MKERRSKIQILVDMLRVVQRKGGRAKSTHILYGANLSHKRLKQHLDMLLENEFLEMVSASGRTYYKITPKGVKFVVEFKKIEDITDAFGISI